MAIRRALLRIKDSEYDILRFNYKFQRDIDSKGRPCSNFYGGELSFLLETTKGMQLIEYMVHKDMLVCDGSIEVLSNDGETSIRWIDLMDAKALIAHFKRNKGGTFSSPYMDEQLKKYPSLQEFLYKKDGVLFVLCDRLEEHNGNINEVKLLYQGEINSPRVMFTLFNDKLEGMTISVDDTSAFQIYVDDYMLYPNDMFSCNLRIVIYDHFGLDRADVEKYGLVAGFRAWYVLQHVRGYKPFLTSMECVVPIEKMSYHINK